MAELVGHDRREEAGGRHDGDDVDRRLARVQRLRQRVPEYEDDDEQDEEPRVVDAHPDAEDPEQRQGA
jgi:hypothetical protein